MAMVQRANGVLSPRNGHTLTVGVVCRISGCQNQKELSLEDQEDNAREIIRETYQGPVEFRIISTKGKGERLDRPELDQIEKAMESGEFDVFVFDDLSRLIRGGEAARLLGVAFDNGTRCICIEDGIDTNDSTWEEDALNACSENVAHNERTSKRIKQKSMNRFKKFGATARRSIYGYIVPDGAKSYNEWRKDPDAEHFILEGARILREMLNAEATAEYFRRNNVPVGPYSRKHEWTGRNVLQFFRNPILKGRPQRGRMTTVKHHGTGQRRSVRNPSGPTYYDADHLAYFAPDEYDALIATLAERNQHFRRKVVNGVDPRANVPRKRTRFPGQWSRCWYCGHPHTWGANGITEHLICRAAREWRCWDSVGFNGEFATKQLVTAITAELYRHDAFDEQLRELVDAAQHEDPASIAQRMQQLKEDEESLDREKTNFKNAIAKFGADDMFEERLRKIRTDEFELGRKRQELLRSAHRKLIIPKSVTELRYVFEEEFRKFAIDSPEFGMLMRQLVPDFYVYLVRLCDGGHLLPRAKVRLTLDGITPDARHVPVISDLLTRELTLDLFLPPQRERIREEAVRLASEFTHREIAQRISEKPTATAVQNALALDQLMKARGLDTPYELVLTPPDDYPKQRRHKNSKYKFTPIEGYTPPPL
jgi:site-specific DNA recombinase